MRYVCRRVSQGSSLTRTLVAIVGSHCLLRDEISWAAAGHRRASHDFVCASFHFGGVGLHVS